MITWIEEVCIVFAYVIKYIVFAELERVCIAQVIKRGCTAHSRYVYCMYEALQHIHCSTIVTSYADQLQTEGFNGSQKLGQYG